jgi:glycosyltransferase involved in cell wall biosynthesis
MTIVHVITRLILGGAQQNTVLTCTAQAAAGHAVTLIYGPIYGPEGSLLEEARKSGASLVKVSALRRPIMPLHDYYCYHALRRRIREIRPDIVHTHSSKAGIIGRAAAWDERVPVVIHTIHGLPFHSRQPRWLYRVYVATERWAARRCHKLIGVTQAMCEAFRRHGIGAPAQFEVVPSGVVLADFALPPGTRDRVRRELRIPAEASVIGIVARLDKLKGQEDLLAIFPSLIQRHGKVWLLMVGDGWYRRNLEAQIRRDGLQERVVLTGLVSPGRVAELLCAMDINTLPSYQEGQPRTLIQALLAGCAIVGYDAGGIPEICLDRQTGRLVPVGDREALRQAISDLLEAPDERRRLAVQGKEHVSARFDHRLMVKRLEEIYLQASAKK